MSGTNTTSSGLSTISSANAIVGTRRSLDWMALRIGAFKSGGSSASTFCMKKNIEDSSYVGEEVESKRVTAFSVPAVLQVGHSKFDEGNAGDIVSGKVITRKDAKQSIQFQPINGDDWMNHKHIQKHFPDIAAAGDETAIALRDVYKYAQYLYATHPKSAFSTHCTMAISSAKKGGHPDFKFHDPSSAEHKKLMAEDDYYKTAVEELIEICYQDKFSNYGFPEEFPEKRTFKDPKDGEEYGARFYANYKLYHRADSNVEPTGIKSVNELPKKYENIQAIAENLAPTMVPIPLVYYSTKKGVVRYSNRIKLAEPVKGKGGRKVTDWVNQFVDPIEGKMAIVLVNLHPHLGTGSSGSSFRFDMTPSLTIIASQPRKRAMEAAPAPAMCIPEEEEEESCCEESHDESSGEAEPDYNDDPNTAGPPQKKSRV